MYKNTAALAGITPLSAALLPTPLYYLASLRQSLGDQCPHILVKRDDLTGLSLGGNKARKLGYLLADARSKNADTIITCGAAQSNHALQTAMAARKFGFDVHCVLYGEPPDADSLPTGNLLLHELTGTPITWTTQTQSETRREQAMRRTMSLMEERLTNLGKRVYSIPVGGSTAIGALGYVEAVQELTQQLDALSNVQISAIFFASGSGGTQAGMMAGAEMARWNLKIIGVEIDPVPIDSCGISPYHRSVERLTAETLTLLKIDKKQTTNTHQYESSYTGSAYGSSTPECKEALRLLASTEGVILDPVYTGKAMAALLGWIRSGRFSADETILFWHTGGAAGLFASH